MKRLKALTARIDRMVLRERVLLFVALLTVPVMLAYSISIQPSLRRQQLLIERMKQDQSQIDAMHKELQALASKQEAPDLAAQDKLVQLQQRLKGIESELEEKQRHLVPAGKVSDLLRSIILKTSRVELASLVSFPGEKVTPPAAGAGSVPVPSASPAKGNPSGQPATPRPPEPGLDIYKHGVEITLHGSYMDLLAYVTELEQSRWRLIWGPITLNAEQYPSVTLRVSVYTLSTEPAAITF